MMSVKAAASRLAPPTRRPSIGLGDQLGRVVGAPSRRTGCGRPRPPRPRPPATRALMCAQASWASTAVRPAAADGPDGLVGEDQARHDLGRQPLERRQDLGLEAPSVSPWSRCSRTPPRRGRGHGVTQDGPQGRRHVSSARPKSVRRSEWPTMTYAQPGQEGRAISPVQAPSSSLNSAGPPGPRGWRLLDQGLHRAEIGEGRVDRDVERPDIGLERRPRSCTVCIA